jgi:cytoskeletal protein RodZ
MGVVDMRSEMQTRHTDSLTPSLTHSLTHTHTHTHDHSSPLKAAKQAYVDNHHAGDQSGRWSIGTHQLAAGSESHVFRGDYTAERWETTSQGHMDWKKGMCMTMSFTSQSAHVGE